jgi:hypothetical protein
VSVAVAVAVGVGGTDVPVGAVVAAGYDVLVG